MALVWGEGLEGKVCILGSPGITASPISLSSMGGVCGRSLTAGKILFTGIKQNVSVYPSVFSAKRINHVQLALNHSRRGNCPDKTRQI